MAPISPLHPFCTHNHSVNHYKCRIQLQHLKSKHLMAHDSKTNSLQNLYITDNLSAYCMYFKQSYIINLIKLNNINKIITFTI